jgi:predicted metalloprotease with PDZ domain
MKTLKSLLFGALLAGAAVLPTNEVQAQEKSYQYKIDLNAVQNDIMTVELTVPQLGEKSLRFWLPRMVPGTYAVYDFSRFVVELTAYNAKGKKMKAKRSKDGMYWDIKKADKLAKIVYTVEDTWDTKKSNVIFEPAGTNFTDDKSVFVFNNHGIFGYFEKHERLPYKLEIDRPANLFGGTSLTRTGGDADTDIFLADDYHALVDAPIMFAPPDTVQFKIGKTDVLIHTFSPTGRVKSKDLLADIKPILEAQNEYLGGTLPVDKYVFLLFLNKEGQSYKSGAAGALEHSYSSFYCLFEGEASAIGQTVRDVAAHEFFHIITPLFIHSEEIHYFDFANPKMSEHLWLYEGVTEYSAQHVQVAEKLQSVEEFLNNMAEKLRASKSFKDDIAFTEMSKTCLDKNKSQYSNVYLKGALIGMAIDLKLRALTNGKYGIQNVLKDLAKKYGIKQPFKDSELFDEIAAVSNQPSIKQFLLDYVGGTGAIPYDELLQPFGVSYKAEGEVKEVSKFGISDMQRGFSFDAKEGKLSIKSAKYIDKFGKALGWEEGDLVDTWNGEKLTMENINTILGTHDQSAKEGTILKVGVLRKNEAGVLEEKQLEAKITSIISTKKHVFIANENPTPAQVELRKSWIGQ